MCDNFPRVTLRPGILSSFWKFLSPHLESLAPTCVLGHIITSYYFGSERDPVSVTGSNDQPKANVVLNV